FRVSGSHDAPNANTTTSPRTLSDVTVWPLTERNENSGACARIDIVADRISTAVTATSAKAFLRMFFSIEAPWSSLTVQSRRQCLDAELRNCASAAKMHEKPSKCLNWFGGPTEYLQV